MMDDRSAGPIQHAYPENFQVCLGCGRLNDNGYHVESYWLGDEAVCTFHPQPHHTAFPGFVYGGLIASLIDCHACATASAAEGERTGNSDPLPRFMTGTLNVVYLKPTPIDSPLELRARAVEFKGRKVTVAVELHAAGELRAKGEVIAFRIESGA